MRISNPPRLMERTPNSPPPGLETPKAEQQQPFKLSEEDQKTVDQLKARDREVRAHERAHASAGGHMAGAPNYQFQAGPDGQRYAVGGDVSIQMPSSKDPAVRAQEARQVRAAATAPSSPSSQDLKVAAAASKIEMEALAEMREEKTEKSTATSEEPSLKVCENCGSVHGLEKIQIEAQQQSSSVVQKASKAYGA